MAHESVVCDAVGSSAAPVPASASRSKLGLPPRWTASRRTARRAWRRRVPRSMPVSPLPGSAGPWSAPMSSRRALRASTSMSRSDAASAIRSSYSGGVLPVMMAETAEKTIASGSRPAPTAAWPHRGSALSHPIVGAEEVVVLVREPARQCWCLLGAAAADDYRDAPCRLWVGTPRRSGNTAPPNPSLSSPNATSRYSSVSSSRAKRSDHGGKGIPNASCSTSIHPVPTPRSRRPPDIWSMGWPPSLR